MAANNWPADRRTEVAAERILDAAGELFAQRPVAAVGMNEIASAAGCSRRRCTRYFDSRQAPHTAYAHREAHQLQPPDHRDADRDRRSPAAVGDRPGHHPGHGARQSGPAVVVQRRRCPDRRATGRPVRRHQRDGVGVRGVVGRASDDAAAVDRKARWLVRVLTSLLLFPGHDADDERAMIEEFLVPIVAPIQR